MVANTMMMMGTSWLAMLSSLLRMDQGELTMMVVMMVSTMMLGPSNDEMMAIDQVQSTNHVMLLMLLSWKWK